MPEDLPLSPSQKLLLSKACKKLGCSGLSFILRLGMLSLEELRKIPDLCLNFEIHSSFFAKAPLPFWQNHQALPILGARDRIQIACLEPHDSVLQREIKALDPDQTYEFLYAEPSLLFKLLGLSRVEGICLDDLLQIAFAVEASDIHLHPQKEGFEILFRVDGQLKSFLAGESEAWPSLCNRLKIKAKLDITETRLPQSGHFEDRVSGHLLDCRVSTHPTLFGEAIVMRLLDKSKTLKPLKELGFHPLQQEALEFFCRLSEGILILCGPTGSGKTTTLYSLLQQMDRSYRNIVTLEEPVEYHLPGIRQTEIQEGGMSFAQGVRSLLRQDPDVILIGEIRDEETAQMAFRAALTGHLVLTTLHTGTAAGVPERLKDLGVEPHLICEYLRGVVCQRLARHVCTRCQFKGCSFCYGEGFQGRSVIAEVWVYHAEENKPYVPLSFKEHGLYKLKKGEITQEEINRLFL